MDMEGEGGLEASDVANQSRDNTIEQLLTSENTDNFEDLEAESNEFEDYGGSDEEDEEDVVHQAPPSNLQQACEYGDVDTVIKMLNGGDDANKMERDGRTPLHIASSLGNTELIRILLKHNAIPTIITNDSKFQTCLHIASINGSSDAIQTIIEAVQAADGPEETLKFISTKDSKGNSAIHYAAENGLIL